MQILARALLASLVLAAPTFAQGPWSGTTPLVAPATPSADPAKLVTHYFRLTASVWAPDEGEEYFFPVIVDGLEKDPRTRTRDARKFFTDRGVSFPEGASAIYHEAASILAITNTPEPLAQAAKAIRAVYGPQTRILQCEARIVEFLPEMEQQLAGRHSFAALQEKLGTGLKTVCISTITTKSGSRVYGELDHGNQQPAKSTKAAKPTNPARPAASSEQAPDWPPPPGVERAVFECEPTIGPAEAYIDLNVSLRYATPARAGHPALVSKFTSNLTLRPGIIFKARTFTIADLKQEAPRYFAILLLCEMLDESGRTTAQARDLLRKSPPPPTPH
jgi:hypothetical protein